MRRIGRYSVGCIVLENFVLDGGAMFGAIPKTLWDKLITVDDRNRIPLCTRVLVIDGPKGRILVDVGNGGKWSDKLRDIFQIEALHSKPVHELISDVSHVILTHMHFDHGGGATYKSGSGNSGGGEILLSFPQATHYLQSANWERANNPGVRERGSYLVDSVLPLKTAQLKLVEDGAELFKGITVHRSDGHTKGMQWVLIEDELQSIAYPSDLVPTAHHISSPYVMGYDLWPEKTIEEKERFLELAKKGNWIVIFEHDRETIGGRIKVDGAGKYILEREDFKDFSFGS